VRYATGPRAGDVDAAVGWIKLAAPGNDELTLVCELGDDPPSVSQGFGGWAEVERPGRVSMTVWRGYPPISVDVAVVLDRFDSDEGTGIEAGVQILEAMAGRGERRSSGGPPELTVQTAGVMPHDHTASPSLRWVITDLTVVDDSVIVNGAGNWTRASFQVALLQHVTDQGLASQTAKVRARTRGKARRKPYRVRAGQDLIAVARDALHDGARWRELARLNNIRDPRSKLKAGRQIKLP